MKKVIFPLLAVIIMAGCGREKPEQEIAPEPVDDTTQATEYIEEQQAEIAEETEAQREFNKKLSTIEALEQKADFSEALKLCRAALAETDVPAEAEKLNRKIQKLTAAQNETLELSYAIESLADRKDRKALLIATRKLKESGETGRILLRKAVREGDEKLVEAAASILVELNDEQAPAVFAERLASNPPKPISEALVRILRESGKDPDYSPVSELFFDTFAGYSNMTILGDGFNGWHASSEDCFVQNEVVAPTSRLNNSGAVAIPMVTTLSNRLKTGRNVASVWISMDMRPVHYDGEEPPGIDPEATAMFYINTDGYYVTRDNETWRTNSVNPVTGKPAVSVSSEDFVRIHLYQNYMTKKWDIFSDGELVAGGLPFINKTAETIKGFEISNGSGSTAFIDNVFVVTNIPPELKDNSDIWMAHWSGAGK